MTYSLNGVPFDNPTYGWIFRATSKPIAELSQALVSATRQGRHGVLSTAPGVLDAPSLALVVQTPRQHLRTLEAFVRAGGNLTSVHEAGTAVVEFASLSPVGYGNADETLDVTILFRVPAAAARGALATTTAAALDAASVTVGNLFPGLSLEVQDALIIVKGAAAGLQVTDSAGSWFTYADAITAAQWLRFDLSTGRAFVTTSETWSGGTEVSGRVDFGGPRGLFEITPAWTGDPAQRAGVLTVATASRTGATVRVRGRSAYLV